MVFLGRKYKFHKFEIDKLNKKFKEITIIKYTDRDENEVLAELDSKIQNSKKTLLVLNTKAKVGDKIIQYLTKQKLKPDKKLKIITIEHFMEKYLFKCYIPDSHTELDYLEDMKPYNIFEYILKRAVDYIGVFCLALLSWPIMLYARKKIKEESPGTSMFKQLRVGRNGELFRCYKFRSMDINSHHDPYTRENDSRIFPWGQTMRKTRIDELPQLINVLKGDMHFIGPRAEWNILVEKYEKEIPYYHERHLVKPGITGWAQVKYPYGKNIEDTKQKLMYDLYYIKHWNILLELKIIYKTILVVLSKKGI
ncbi:sugar transferase [Campylobacter blaseri]|uniref:Sugar transferase n=1 Tax=Campylobacter blaseri TaxID=2042961 RepID=A0A2P8R281_9BACT|nr:sugar transferase [Campylobacter blaseri]PSM52615.1 sugar transferase [Campylobacter blaseri]PSM54263.1 sugar transferase [Campylobacter blaseri]QKF85914.1 sugar transferase [Campylobacter blaseri]